jgi:phosphopentomutase
MALKLAKEQDEGFIFVNLVDFDMLFGHRQDIDGYAKALSEFDAFLPRFLAEMRAEDRLFIAADHGCDPGDESTDHTREYIPLLMSGAKGNRGTRQSFADIGQTIASIYQISLPEGEKIC